MAYESWEDAGSYLISYFSSKEDAWHCVIGEFPEIMEDYEIDDMELTTSYKCLDCGSFWISDDVCGECGEFRLSKRPIPTYYLSHFNIKQ